MSRKLPDVPTKIVGTRLPTELEQRAQGVARELSRRASGVPVTLSAAMNIIIAKGLDTIEPELGIEAKPAKAKRTA
jgi:hypothetical protein